MDVKQLVCINCPMGCRLNVEVDEGKILSVSGNICKRGEEFAYQEVLEPLRILTSLMRIEGREKPFSVKTSSPIPKRIIFDCANQIFSQPIKSSALPIHVGDILITNICDSGVDIIATQDVI
ncbi:MAG: DUF1667 domain-containing protein [Eubacterium sp.]|nr:DUF1667 domain-containing protein [Eubacterium sp.]